MATTTTTTANHSSGFTHALTEHVANLGSFAMNQIAGIGDVTLFSLKTIGWLFFDVSGETFSFLISIKLV